MNEELGKRRYDYCDYSRKDVILLWRIRYYMTRVDYRSRGLSFEDYIKHVIIHEGDPGGFPKKLCIPGSDYYGPADTFLDYSAR